VLLFLFGCGNNDYARDLETIKARLDMIEERLIQLEKTGQRISPLEFQLNGLQESVMELSRMVAPEPDASASAEKPSSPQDKVRYHEVRQGDTLYGIAQEYGLSVPELMKLNNLTKTQAIYPGQKLLVTPGNAE
jgi:LysM repeat protein